MKARNLNNSSAKTRKLIKTTFIAMLAGKNKINKISVSELTARAQISRATFYSHFTDIYEVAEDFETELIEEFYTNIKLLASDNYDGFFDELFDFIDKNDKNYKMLCRTNDFVFSVKRLASKVLGKFYELCTGDDRIKNREFLELEIKVFVDGLLTEYVKYCRGVSSVDCAQLKAYAKNWHKKFTEHRHGQ